MPKDELRGRALGAKLFGDSAKHVVMEMRQSLSRLDKSLPAKADSIVKLAAKTGFPKLIHAASSSAQLQEISSIG
jgi:hypothetical protein